MSSSRQGKFDAEISAGSVLPAYMFSSVADLISSKDMEIPAPSYTSAFASWRDSAEGEFSEILSSTEVEVSDENAYDIGKQVGFRLLEKFIVKATAVGWASQSSEIRRAAAEEVMARPQIPQRTQEWYAQGKEVLTASEFSKILGTPRTVSQLVMSKVPSNTGYSTNRLACMSCELGPFDWGIRFEPVVKQVLGEKWGAVIAEAGRILHPTDSHVAASPDGIIMEATDPARIGRLIEIKCPITRVIGEGIPYDYWCQMQVQMEVTGIEECEYVEMKFESIQGATTDLSGEKDGQLWLVQNPNTCDMKYAYNTSELDSLVSDGFEITETIPWRVKDMYCVTVARDRAWYADTQALRDQLWENVAKARKGEFQMVEGRSKKKEVIVTKEPAPCMIHDDAL